jgi:hypothetical protein
MHPPILWSIHDLAPATFARCAEMVDRLTAAGVPQIAILIIPSGEWPAAQLETLRRWERQGHLLAAHGWTHRGCEPRDVYHRLHSALFSRDAAEHLGRPSAEVMDIVRRGERWFHDAGLQPPRLYVPPAWALGSLPLAQFRATSFRWVETLIGIYDVRAARFRRLPLVGFEADTRLRARALRSSNRANIALARALGRPLRVAVHPHDRSLLLSADLAALIASRPRSLSPDKLPGG